jgi:hypothetical protein
MNTSTEKSIMQIKGGIKVMVYKNYEVLIKFLLIFFMLLTYANAADLIIDNAITSPTDGIIWVIDSSKDPKEATVTMTVTNQVESPETVTDLVLAIDCSASLGPDQKDPGVGSDPQRKRVDAAKQLVARLRQIDRVGVVLWNDTVIRTPLDLTSNFTEVNAYLKTAGSSGETSLWNALNASKMLLNTARPNSKKVIVLFSDGNDTLEPAMDFKGLASSIKQSGIDIYAVGLGKDKINDLRDIASLDRYYHVSDSMAIPEIFQTIVNEIMRSVNDVEIHYALPVEIEISDPSKTVNLTSGASGQKMIIWNIGSMLPRERKTISFKVRSETMGLYSLGTTDRSYVTYIKTETNNIETTQAIQPVRIEVKGEADFSYSGIGKGGTIYIPFDDEHPEYGLAVTKSIERPTDNGCQDIVINYQIPTMPCDRTVVFALDTSGSIWQSGLNDIMIREIREALDPYLNDPKFKCARIDWDAMNKSAMVQRSNGDWVSGDPENSSIDFSSAFRSGKKEIEELFNDTPRMFVNEYESTFYNAGLEEANNSIWSEMKNLDAFGKETNSFSIVFITARSEFIRNGGLKNVIDFAAKKHIQINCIGLYLEDASTGEEANALYSISNPTGGRLALINDPTSISDKIREFLNRACTDKSMKPVVNNLTIIESLYPYLKVVGTNILPTSGPIRNSDNTTTLVWNLGNLPQGNSSSIRIHTGLDFSKLPVDVTQERTPVNLSPSTATKASMVAFTTNLSESIEPKTQELPEGELSIFCGQACEVCPKQSAAETATVNDSASASKEKPLKDDASAPGFETYLAILGIVASFYLVRRG